MKNILVINGPNINLLGIREKTYMAPKITPICVLLFCSRQKKLGLMLKSAIAITKVSW